MQMGVAHGHQRLAGFAPLPGGIDQSFMDARDAADIVVGVATGDLGRPQEGQRQAPGLRLAGRIGERHQQVVGIEFAVFLPDDAPQGVGAKAAHQRRGKLDAVAAVVVAGDQHDIQVRQALVGADDEVVQEFLGAQRRIDHIEDIPATSRASASRAMRVSSSQSRKARCSVWRSWPWKLWPGASRRCGSVSALASRWLVRRQNRSLTREMPMNQEARMSNPPLHDWNLAPKAAIELQKQLAGRVELEDRLERIRHIAGVDIGFEESGDITRAAVVVLAWPPAAPGEFEVVEQVVHREPTRMPYIPGLLSFREVPAALAAFDKLTTKPELVMVDGQGIAHPRRLGVASHLGYGSTCRPSGLPSRGFAVATPRRETRGATGCPHGRRGDHRRGAAFQDRRQAGVRVARTPPFAAHGAGMGDGLPGAHQAARADSPGGSAGVAARVDEVAFAGVVPVRHGTPRALMLMLFSLVPVRHPGQQQGRRFPALRSALTREMRRCLVSGFLASSTQHIHSLRAMGVMASQSTSTELSPARTCRRSSGTSCTTPAEMVFRIMRGHRMSH